MAEIMKGGEVFKFVGITRYEMRAGGKEEHPTYIRVTSYEETDQIIIAQKGDAFLKVGSIAYRNNPNDRYDFETHNTYIQISPDEVNPKTMNTAGEDALIDDFSRTFARLFYKDVIKRARELKDRTESE